MKIIKLFLNLKVILIPLLIITLLLEGVNVFLTNQISTESVTVNKLTAQIEKYEQSNFTIRSEVLEYTTLETVASRAAQLGFVENKNVISLYESASVAVNVE